MVSDRAISLMLQELTDARHKRIERVVYSGGGAKGVVYPGSYTAIAETGVLKGVKELAGASAGAITGALIAVGMTPPNFRRVLLSTNLEELMGNSIGSVLGMNSAGVCFMTRDGKPLEQFIRHHIIETVRTTLTTVERLGLIASEYPDLELVLSKIGSENPKFTFGDLAILNRYFPDKFKQLVVPAIKFPDGEPQVFNSTLTPNIEIALACRASASLPVILEPVEIEIRGIKQKFIDGGFFDNYPTDYFDTDASGAFTKNKKPDQTMVFAFGEGLDNKKNEVFQALYGERWDEVISEDLLKALIDDAIKLSVKFLEVKHTIDNPEDGFNLLIQYVKSILQQQVKEGKIATEVSEVILNTMKMSIDSLLSTPHEHPEFWHAYHHDKSEQLQIKLLGQLIKKNMRPVLAEATMQEVLVFDMLVVMLSGLNMPYKYTVQNEAGYQKLRIEYALRTVELRVGLLGTTDFSEATKHARVMDAFGYLDTINHIANHDLHDRSTFNPVHFYDNVVNYFEHIYQAVLYGSGKDAKTDPLIQEITALRKYFTTLGKSEMVINRQLYQLIKEKAEGRVDSAEAYALSRAVEFRNGILKADDLFKETYEEGFKRSSLFSVSDITGERFFKTHTLHESLKVRSMFDLYRHKTHHPEKTRTERVFDALQKMEPFHDAYDECLHEKGKFELAAG